MYTSPIVEKLKKAGLEEKEAQIYGYLAETGGAFPSTIAEATKLNRSTVYKLLGILSVRGLVAEIEKKKKLYYFPESPAKFLRASKMKIRLAEDAYAKASELIPELEGLFQTNNAKPRVTFYEGRDQVVEAYMKQVENKKKYELLAFASTDHLQSFLPPKVFREYIKLKEKYGITARGILPDAPTNKKFLESAYSDIKNNVKPVIRYVPKNLFPFSGEIVMYDSNKVLIVKFDEQHPIAIIIEDEMIHDMQKMIFELSWNQAKPK